MRLFLAGSTVEHAYDHAKAERSAVLVRCFSSPASGAQLFRHDVPNAALTVPGFIACFLVILIEVQRLAVIGPLHLTVLAFGQGPILHHLLAGFTQIGRPILGTIVITARDSCLVFIKNIQSHAILGFEHTGVSSRHEQNQSGEQDGTACQIGLHDDNPRHRDARGVKAYRCAPVLRECEPLIIEHMPGAEAVAGSDFTQTGLSPADLGGPCGNRHRHCEFVIS